jgi:hypothetical protein
MNASVSRPDKELFWNFSWWLVLRGTRGTITPSSHSSVIKRNRDKANTVAP